MLTSIEVVAMDFKPFLVVGLMLNSALYLSGVFVAGIASHRPWAWRVALLACGFSYVSYYIQAVGMERKVAVQAVFLSIFFGIVAGLLLLF